MIYFSVNLIFIYFIHKISQANKLSLGLAAVIQLYKNTHCLKFMHFLMSDVFGLFKIQSNQNNRDLKNDFQKIGHFTKKLPNNKLLHILRSLIYG